MIPSATPCPSTTDVHSHESGAHLISVLMPAYNVQAFVSEAIKDVLAQTHARFELLIMDDGSIDQTGDIATEFAATDVRVRVFRRENRGIIASLNELLSLAEGQWIVRMDADDRTAPDRFEVQLRFLMEHPQCVAVGSQAVVIDEEGANLGTADVPLEHEAIQRELLSGRSCMFHPAVMMRGAVLREAGGYREEAYPAEDYDLWLRLSEHGELANLPSRLFTWRRRLGGIYASTTEKQQAVIRRILADAWQRRGLAGSPPEPFIAPIAPHQMLTQWAWRALSAGNVAGARKHAFAALRKSPASLEAWRAMVCTIRGY